MNTDIVSTHSRPKAAGQTTSPACLRCSSFNSQPPEGGWTICLVLEAPFKCFNSQPPEGGWIFADEARNGQRGINPQPPEDDWDPDE